jgi:hypothetical protein
LSGLPAGPVGNPVLPPPPAPDGRVSPWSLTRWGWNDLIAVSLMPFGLAMVATTVLVMFGATDDAWGVALTLVQELAFGLGIWWWVRQHDGSGAPLGLRRHGTTARDIGAGLAAGIGAIAASATVIGVTMQLLGRTELEDPLESFGEAWVLPSVLLALLFAPVCEEIAFRGFLFAGLRQRLRFGWAALISGLAFGAIHGDLVRFPGLTVTGIVLASVYERRRTLPAAMAAHATVNAVAIVGLLASR